MLKNFFKQVKHNYLVPRALNYRYYFYFSSLKEIAPSLEFKELTATLYKKLKAADDEYTELTNKLLKSSMDLSAEELNYIRKRTEEINQHHEIFQEFKECIKTMQDLVNMKKEANGDKETLDFVEEELKNYEEKLEEIEERSIEILIPPEEYDDCNTIKLEIRAG